MLHKLSGLAFESLNKVTAWIFPLPDKTAVAIKCYECTVHPRRTQNGTSFDRLCTKFEDTEYFEVDCPYSTMCKKRVYRYQLINKVQESIERGCADQKNDSMVRKMNFLKLEFRKKLCFPQNYVHNKWVKEVTVDEPYMEGCIKNKDDESEYCHCRGDLCNSAPKIDSKTTLSNGVDTMAVLIVFNLVKYFRNMDYY